MENKPSGSEVLMMFQEAFGIDYGNTPISGVQEQVEASKYIAKHEKLRQTESKRLANLRYVAE